MPKTHDEKIAYVKEQGNSWFYHDCLHSYGFVTALLVTVSQYNLQLIYSLVTNKESVFPSEASTANILQKSIFYMFRFKADLPIIRFILDKQECPFDDSIDTSA